MKFLPAFFCLTACATFVIGSPTTDEGLKIISREQWGAQPPKQAPSPLKEIPPPYVIISHTATDSCSTQAQCALRVRTTQADHMASKGWDDVGYNFLVGGDGNVYEGRGWDVTGAHARNFNARSIGVSFIGTFDTAAPTSEQLAAARGLLEFGLESGKLGKGYKLLGHRQVSSTQSPGQKLYEIIQTWDHWSPAA